VRGRARRIAMTTEEQFCGHGECSCEVTGEQKYCSEHCSKAESAGGDAPCECGHDGCG
jgi:hypothetical protein